MLFLDEYEYENEPLYYCDHCGKALYSGDDCAENEDTTELICWHCYDNLTDQEITHWRDGRASQDDENYTVAVT